MKVGKFSRKYAAPSFGGSPRILLFFLEGLAFLSHTFHRTGYGEKCIYFFFSSKGRKRKRKNCFWLVTLKCVMYKNSWLEKSNISTPVAFHYFLSEVYYLSFMGTVIHLQLHSPLLLFIETEKFHKNLSLLVSWFLEDYFTSPFPFSATSTIFLIWL